MGLTGATLGKPARGLGGFFALSLEIMVQLVRPPFAWRELMLQSWLVARVSILPTLLLTIPFTVPVLFTLNIRLIEFGAADFSGTGVATTSVTPVVTVLMIAGAGAAAICVDLGGGDGARGSLATALGHRFSRPSRLVTLAVAGW
jgi:phospholipid/cholesterol/gamma-HCH transport system permease protein